MTTVEETSPANDVVDYGRLGDAERVVVSGVAEYYWQNDGMPKDRGSVIGYLIVCDPPQQRISEICAKLSVSREAVDRVCDQLVPARVIVREADGKDDDDRVYLLEDSWPNAVKHVFANIPEFATIVTDGIAVLADAPPERRERIERVERLFTNLAAEIPAVFDRFTEQQKTAAKTASENA